ncbi:MAG: hypothetical protein KF799_04185 [Bdellovibrionales bacterium]|nr:hypothetical protein [Bdellovibrionales bacterium]
MKALFLSLLFVLSLPALAEDEVGAVTYKLTGEKSIDFTKNNFTEVGFSMSSINNGSRFTNMVIAHDFANGFTLGARGLIPIDYGRGSETYMGQVFGRFPILNAENIIYIEAAITQGFFNADTLNGTDPFAMLGATYGYARRFKNDFSAGLALGVDWSTSRISRDIIVSSSSLVNHVTLTGGYYF